MPRYAAFLRGVSPMNAKMPELKPPIPIGSVFDTCGPVEKPSREIDCSAITRRRSEDSFADPTVLLLPIRDALFEGARAPFGVELSCSIGRLLSEHRREALKEPMPSPLSRRRSVSAVEECALFGVDEARAAVDCLEFHRAQRRGYVRSVDSHRVRHHDAPVRHDVEVDRLVAGLGAVAAAKSPMFAPSDAEVERVLLDSPPLALCEPLALGRRVAPRSEYAIRGAVVRALGDDGVVN